MGDWAAAIRMASMGDRGERRRGLPRLWRASAGRANAHQAESQLIPRRIGNAARSGISQEPAVRSQLPSVLPPTSTSSSNLSHHTTPCIGTAQRAQAVQGWLAQRPPKRGSVEYCPLAHNAAYYTSIAHHICADFLISKYQILISIISRIGEGAGC